MSQRGCNFLGINIAMDGLDELHRSDGGEIKCFGGIVFRVSSLKFRVICSLLWLPRAAPPSGVCHRPFWFIFPPLLLLQSHDLPMVESSLVSSFGAFIDRQVQASFMKVAGTKKVQGFLPLLT